MIYVMKVNLRLLLLLFALLVGLSSCIKQRAVFRAERDRFDAQVQRDMNFLDDHLDERLVYIHSNALVENKQDFLRSISNRSIEYRRMNTIGDRNFRLLGGRNAIVTGRLEVQGLYGTFPFATDLLYTSIYRRQGGKWKLVSWQSTGL